MAESISLAFINLCAALLFVIGVVVGGAAAWLWTRALMNVASAIAQHEAVIPSAAQTVTEDPEDVQYPQPAAVDAEALAAESLRNIRARRVRRADEATTTDENAGIRDDEVEPVGGTKMYRDGARA